MTRPIVQHPEESSCLLPHRIVLTASGKRLLVQQALDVQALSVAVRTTSFILTIHIAQADQTHSLAAESKRHRMPFTHKQHVCITLGVACLMALAPCSGAVLHFLAMVGPGCNTCQLLSCLCIGLVSSSMHARLAR